jgi:DNA mismatch endonuclease (patch repair protein)
MKRIRQSQTAPEQLVQSVLRDLGITFRVGARNLPGRPDIVNLKQRWAIFVHGCFWHGHAGCNLVTVETTNANAELWKDRLAANTTRDARKARALRKLGFSVITVWECETRNRESLTKRLKRVLGPPRAIEMGGDDKAFLRGKRPRAKSGGSPVRLVDLFSGCGGLSLGVAEAARSRGQRCVVRLAVELDEVISRTYRANFAVACGTAAFPPMMKLTPFPRDASAPALTTSTSIPRNRRILAAVSSWVASAVVGYIREVCALLPPCDPGETITITHPFRGIEVLGRVARLSFA